MGNQTKVTHVAVAGAASYLIVAVLKYMSPELMQSMPGAEGAITTLLTVVATYLTRA